MGNDAAFGVMRVRDGKEENVPGAAIRNALQGLRQYTALMQQRETAVTDPMAAARGVFNILKEKNLSTPPQQGGLLGLVQRAAGKKAPPASLADIASAMSAPANDGIDGTGEVENSPASGWARVGALPHRGASPMTPQMSTPDDLVIRAKNAQATKWASADRVLGLPHLMRKPGAPRSGDTGSLPPHRLSDPSRVTLQNVIAGAVNLPSAANPPPPGRKNSKVLVPSEMQLAIGDATFGSQDNRRNSFTKTAPVAANRFRNAMSIANTGAAAAGPRAQTPVLPPTFGDTVLSLRGRTGQTGKAMGNMPFVNRP